MHAEASSPNLSPSIDPPVLGKILLLQAALHAIPNPDHLADFLCRGLETIPGTASVAVQIAPSIKVSDPSHAKETFESDICQRCRQEKISENGFSAPGQHHGTNYCIRIQTIYARYGCLLFEMRDRSQLEPYQPFLENLANTVALTLELRNHECSLQQVNDELLTIKAGLEILVQERTKELTLRNAELERWAHIFEHAEWGVVICAADGGRIELMNPAFARLHQWSIQEIADQPLAKVFAPEARAEIPSQLQIAQEKGHHIWETIHIRKDGSRFSVLMDLSAVKNELGQTLYIVVNCQDITERKLAEAAIHTQLERLKALHHIDNAIKSNSDLRSTHKIILGEVTRQLNIDAAAILLFNRDTLTLDLNASCGFRSNGLPDLKHAIDDGYAGRVLLDRKMIHIADITKTEEDLSNALSIGEEKFVGYLGAPLIAKDQVVGVLEIFQRSPLTPNQDWFDFLDGLAAQTAIAIENAQLFENLQRSNTELTLAYEATIEGWSRALDLRDKETEGHTQRVTNLTVQLAQEMGFSKNELVHIRHGALLHDIGKMGIPDNILLKPDELTSQEWESMRKHTIYAYEMLRPIQYLRPALDIPRYHHEKWDGTGYPYQIHGEDIPLSARIFAVVDVWDAVTSNRPYRAAWPKEEAIAYIQSEAGRHFDVKVVEVFLSLIKSEQTI